MFGSTKERNFRLGESLALLYRTHGPPEERRRAVRSGFRSKPAIRYCDCTSWQPRRGLLRLPMPSRLEIGPNGVLTTMGRANLSPSPSLSLFLARTAP